MTTMAEVPAGVGPGGGGPGSTDELPPPHEEKSNITWAMFLVPPEGGVPVKSVISDSPG